MPSETTGNKAAGMVPDELKFEPKSTGLTTPRKKKPKELAVITECCTGCAGSPACVEYCPVADCMFWVPDEDHEGTRWTQKYMAWIKSPSAKRVRRFKDCEQPHPAGRRSSEEEILSRCRDYSARF